MANKILVTGATGRTGSELIKALQSAGADIRAMDRDPEKIAALSEQGIESVVGDLEKPETIEQAMEGIDKAFLLSIEDPRLGELHGNFAKAAQQAGVKHLVRMSILVAMMPDSPLVIGKWHREADQAVMESGVPYTILQPAYFMQNILRSADMIKAKDVLPGGMGDGKVGVIDLRDIAATAAAVLTNEGHEGKTYVLTGPEALSMADMAVKLSAVLGREITYMNMQPEEAKAGMTKMGMPDEIADAWVAVGQMISMGKADMVTDAVKEVTGQVPRSFDQFAQDFAGMFKDA